jgi:hypothetical protein
MLARKHEWESRPSLVERRRMSQYWGLRGMMAMAKDVGSREDMNI